MYTLTLDQSPPFRLHSLQADFEEERGRRVKEVAYDLNRRLRQELAAPVIIHFVVTQV